MEFEEQLNAFLVNFLIIMGIGEMVSRVNKRGFAKSQDSNYSFASWSTYSRFDSLVPNQHTFFFIAINAYGANYKY